MWKKISKRIQNVAFFLLPISLIFYFSLTTIIPRNTYIFLNQTKKSEFNISSLNKKESTEKIKVRKKLLQDFRYHKSSITWDEKMLTKLLVNQEGKIIGYKLYNIFYPNYFTKTQLKNLLRSSYKIKRESYPIKAINLSKFNM
jgi:hypothetical protein